MHLCECSFIGHTVFRKKLAITTEYTTTLLSNSSNSKYFSHYDDTYIRYLLLKSTYYMYYSKFVSYFCYIKHNTYLIIKLYKHETKIIWKEKEKEYMLQLDTVKF